MEKHYSKKNDPKRRLRSFLKHTWILIKALVLASIITGAWHIIQAKGIHLPHEDEAIVVGTVTTLGVIYGMFATITMALVSDKWSKVTAAIFKRDKAAFLILRDERLSITHNMVTGIAAFAVLLIMGVMEYHKYSSGFASMSSVSLVMSLIYVGIRDLQDVTKSQWVQECVEASWLTENVNDYFFVKGSSSQSDPGTE
jgi:hypothetical protein